MTPRTPTAEDLSTVLNLGELPFALPNVTWPDGSPFEITIRARSIRLRALCHRAAIKAGVEAGIEFDDDTYAVYTFFHGMSKPKLEDSQIGIIWSMNAYVIDQVVDALERLEKLPARALQTELERMAGVAIPAKEAKRRATQPRRDRTPVDSDPSA